MREALFARFLHDLRGLQEIRLTTSETVIPILSLLGVPLESPASEDGSPTWLCPNLRILNITSEKIKLQGFLEFVTSRYRHPSGYHPAKLERLQVSNMFIIPIPLEEEMEKIGPQINEVLGKDIFKMEGLRASALRAFRLARSS